MNTWWQLWSILITGLRIFMRIHTFMNTIFEKWNWSRKLFHVLNVVESTLGVLYSIQGGRDKVLQSVSLETNGDINFVFTVIK